MTPEIEFSIMAPNAEGIQPLLERFEAEQGIRVRLRLLAWDTGWSTLVRAALYSDGPDVSEVGTTWVGDLIGMNALRPFSAAEVAALGKASAFYPSAWKTTGQAGDSQVWSIPWLIGSRLMYYRPELLAQAGIDPAHAFSTIEQTEAAIRQLQASGHVIPWTVPTGYTHTTLLNIASWVWAAGGDFLSPDGRSTRFTEPAAVAGMRAYFRLGRYLAGEYRSLNGLEPDQLFLSKKETALTISGPWLFCEAQRRASGSSTDPIGVAVPPGPTFVGGSNLVAWKYSRHPEAVVKLIHFLTQRPAQISYCQYVGLLPARLEALSEAPFAAHPFWQISMQALQSGKSFPTIRLWGLVEDRLTAGLSAIWQDVLACPEDEPESIILRHLTPIARRLDPLLKQG